MRLPARVNQKTFDQFIPCWIHKRRPKLLRVFLLLFLQKKKSFLPLLSPPGHHLLTILTICLAPIGAEFHDPLIGALNVNYTGY